MLNIRHVGNTDRRRLRCFHLFTQQRPVLEGVALVGSATDHLDGGRLHCVYPGKLLYPCLDVPTG